MARERKKTGEQGLRVLKRETFDALKNTVTHAQNTPLLKKYIAELEQTYANGDVPIEGIASLAWQHTKRENSLINIVRSEIRDFLKGTQIERSRTPFKLVTERNADVQIRVGEHFDLDPKEFPEAAMSVTLKGFIDFFAKFFKTPEAKKLFNSPNAPKQIMRDHVNWNEFFQFMPILLGSVPAVLLSGFMSESITQRCSEGLAKKVTTWRNQKRINEAGRQASVSPSFINKAQQPYVGFVPQLEGAVLSNGVPLKPPF